MSGLRRSGFQGKRTRLNQVSPNKSDRRQTDKLWSLAVLTRDRFTCQAGPDGPRDKRVPEVDCGGRRDPHHIWPKGQYPELRHDPDNGITLCRRHHDWVHFQDPGQARTLGLKGGDGDG